MGDGREFLRECKRMSGSVIPKCFRNVGTSGNTYIAALFAEECEDIYNTSRDNPQDISNLQGAIDHHIAVETSCDLSVVEVSEVTDGIKSLKHDKWDGSEGIYSNHILLSSEIFREHVASLFTVMLRHIGYNPEYMLEAIISYIPKNTKESIQCCANYRGIALSSALSKIFDNMIIQRFSDKLMSSDMQSSFEANHSTVMCACAVNEIAAHYNEKGNNVYIYMLDASMAFDKVNSVRLFLLTEIFLGFSFA